MISKIAGIPIISLMTIVGLFSMCGKKEVKSPPEETYVSEFYEDGAPKEFGVMVDSMHQGLWVTFHPNGIPRIISFHKNDKMEGALIFYYDNGQLSFYSEMKDGVFHGKRVTYYDNGLLASEASFVNDSIDGLVKHYDEEGKIEDIIEYEKGRYIRTVYGSVPAIEDVGEE